MKEYGDGEGHVTFNGFVTMMAKKLKDKDSEAELTEALRCECILLSFAMHVDVGVRVKVVCAQALCGRGRRRDWCRERVDRRGRTAKREGQTCCHERSSFVRTESEDAHHAQVLTNLGEKMSPSEVEAVMQGALAHVLAPSAAHVAEAEGAAVRGRLGLRRLAGSWLGAS